MATLITILAHPDDEAFGVSGTVAKAVAGGHRVVIVCATRGEVGEISDPSLATPETLGHVREAELRKAATALGASDVRVLGYRDSGMAGTADNRDPRALANAPAEEVVGRLVAIIREVRPDVVVTFGPEGVYGHPDHMTISRHCAAAFDAAADPVRWPEAGPAHRAARLYHLAFSRSELRRWSEMAGRLGTGPGALRGVDIDEMGVPDEDITTVIDVGPWLERKHAAIAAHATQRSPLLDRMTAEERDRWLSTERFVIVRGDDVTAARGDPLAGL